MTMVHLPATADVEEAHAILDRDGVVVLRDAAPEATMSAADRELGPWLERPASQSPMGNNAFTGMATLRTSGLVAKSAACRELVMSPPVLALAERVLGPQCSRFQLSFTQAIRIDPGERAQVLHQDTTMYPLRRPGPEVFLNAIWALTEFSPDNGATRFHRGSHRWPEDRAPGPADEVDAAAMPRGSVVVYYGSCWHGGGANTTERPRVGVAFGYTLGWLRQEENQYLAVPPDVARTLPVELQRLLGYAEHYPFLGWHEGEDVELFRGGRFRKQYGTTVAGGAARSVSQIMSPGSAARRDEEPSR